MKQKNGSIAPALRNGLRIIDALAGAEESVAFNRISEMLGVSKATTSRLLRVLMEAGYVVKDARGGYRPGPRMSLIDGGSSLVERFRSESSALLDELSRRVSNTVLAVFWNGRELQCVAKVVVQSSVPMQKVGTITSDLSVYPWGWLAYHYMNALQRGAAEMRMSELDVFRKWFETWEAYYLKNGFMYDDQMFFKPLRRLTAPVFKSGGELVGALGVGGNPLTIPDEKVFEFGKVLTETSEMLSEKL